MTAEDCRDDEISPQPRPFPEEPLDPPLTGVPPIRAPLEETDAPADETA